MISLSDTTVRDELLTPMQASVVAGLPVRAVNKLIDERLPRAAVRRQRGRRYLTELGLVCAVLDREMAKDTSVALRKRLYRQILREPTRTDFRLSPVLSVNISELRGRLRDEIRRYRQAMNLISEDPDVQGGVACFKGTRLPVRQVADLLAQGTPVEELYEDYPSLTPERAEAARIYARAHPRRGRPRSPSWRSGEPTEEKTVARPSA